MNGPSTGSGSRVGFATLHPPYFFDKILRWKQVVGKIEVIRLDLDLAVAFPFAVDTATIPLVI